jgi:pyrroline-5-carboxylate reductase
MWQIVSQCHVVILAFPSNQVQTMANELNGKFGAPEGQMVLALMGGTPLRRLSALFSGSQNVAVFKSFLVLSCMIDGDERTGRR